jgi:hypothetical protein
MNQELHEITQLRHVVGPLNVHIIYTVKNKLYSPHLQLSISIKKKGNKPMITKILFHLD